MTPREVIQANLAGSAAPRIGMNFDRGRWNDLHMRGPDASSAWSQRVWSDGRFEYYDDPWGNVWRRMPGMSQKGEIDRPALPDWSDLPKLRLPDFGDPGRYRTAREAFARDTALYRVGFLPGFPFDICRYLRKMEIYFQDLHLERSHVDRLHGMVTDLLEETIARWAEAGADAVMFGEDWGVQDRLLIRPEMWREIYKPLFARLCGAARSRGLAVIMHSCGYVWDILGDLAEVGVNAMQFDQPALYGLDRLSPRLRLLGLALHAPVDIQRVLPTGERETIEEEARRMVALFEGRFIAKNYPDLHGIGVEEEWDQWAYAVFAEAAGNPREEPHHG